MANDHGLRKTFREHLKLRKFDVMAVETRGVSTGAPDSNYCKRGIEVWVEHKRMDSGGVTIRPAQVGWIERRLDHGGRVFVAVRDGTTLSLYHGSSIRQLQDQPLAAVAHVGRWYHGPGGWDWSAIEDILLRWKPLK